MLGVDAFVSKVCSPYTTPQTLANNIKSDGLDAVRQCYAFLGPQPAGRDPIRPDLERQGGHTRQPQRLRPGSGRITP